MFTEEMFGTQLEDDESSCGGVSFPGETLRDFLTDIDINPLDINIYVLNGILKDCGIRPLKNSDAFTYYNKRITEAAYHNSFNDYETGEGEIQR